MNVPRLARAVIDGGSEGQPVPGPPASSVGDLRHAAAQGAKWNFLSIILTQGGRLAFTFVLARLLGPESFGIMAQATIYVGLTLLVLDQGFAVALVQKRVLDQRDIGAVRLLNLIAGIVMAVATILAAPAGSCVARRGRRRP